MASTSSSAAAGDDVDGLPATAAATTGCSVSDETPICMTYCQQELATAIIG
jgi:hypothetical protein